MTVLPLAQTLLRRKLADQNQLFAAIHYLYLRLLQAGELGYQLVPGEGRIDLVDRHGKHHNSLAIASPAAVGGVAFSPDCLARLGMAGEWQGIQPRKGHWSWTRVGGLLEGCLHVSHWADGRVGDARHWDLFVPEGGGDSIAVGDRAKGELIVIEPTLAKVLARHDLRPAGSTRSLEAAWWDGAWYVPDSQSPDLLRADHQRVERIYQEAGRLGSLVAHGDRLYAVVKGEAVARIAAFGRDPWRLLGACDLPGKWFSDVDDPFDLIGVTPDGQHVVVMTYQDTPSLFTPLLTRVATAEMSVVGTQMLKTEEKPLALGFGGGPVALPKAPTFQEVLLERGVLDQAALQEALRELDRLEESSRGRPLVEGDLLAKAALSPEAIRLLKPTAEALGALKAGGGLEWGGRPGMTEAERHSLLTSIQKVEAPPEAATANGHYVSDWILAFFDDVNDAP